MTTVPALASKTGIASFIASTNAATPNLNAANANAAQPATDYKTKARSQATDFEAVFLNSMISQMFTGMDGEGPLGGAGGAGVWRSFLTDEYSKSFAKSGGIGIADHVYRSLLAQQEARGG
jgi:Rod binding domain-containing protein